MPAFVDTMAYSGQTPWHGLGTRLSEDAVTNEMIQAAGLDWNVVKVPVEYADIITGVRKELPNRFLLARSDNGKIVGPNPVAKSFAEVQNRQLFEFGDALTATGEARWHTAGSLHGGSRIWALAQVAGQFDIQGDILVPYLLLYDARDKSSTFKCRFVATRVVCANTASYALNEKTASEVSIRHTGDLESKLETAREVLGLASASFEQQVEVYRQLKEESFSFTQMVDFAAQMLTGEDEIRKAHEVIKSATDRSKGMYDRKGLEMVNLFKHGRGNEGVSKADAFNSVTEYIDHQRGRMGNYRRAQSKLTPEGLNSAWFGDGERKKKRALKLLVGGGTEK